MSQPTHTASVAICPICGHAYLRNWRHCCSPDALRGETPTAGSTHPTARVAELAEPRDLLPPPYGPPGMVAGP